MKNIYFASDLHLGAPNKIKSLEREKRFVSWLEEIRKDAESIYLLGDIFDFWFEYKKVVPKGYTRLFGKISEITDSGIPIFFFTGNHDMWTFNYLKDELGITEIYKEPIQLKLNNLTILLGHGDGLGNGDCFYKILKQIFRSRFCQFLFSRIHPNLGISIAEFWSKKSRKSNHFSDDKTDINNDPLIMYCKKMMIKNNIDYFIFGHRHTPMNINLGNNTRYINLGDWISKNSYAVFNGKEIELKYFN